MKTKCLIVDDEPLAIDALSMLIQKFEDLEIAGVCSDAFQAHEFLRTHQIDLMFLDIQMPEISGINFLESLPSPPHVIFTTAHREYALDAFELNVVDYLLKPISQQRLMKAINKYYQLAIGRGHMNVDKTMTEETIDKFLYVKADRKTVKIPIHDILFIEGLKDYVRIITTDQNVITHKSLADLEQTLPESAFSRVHRSYIVALDKITSFTAEDVEIGKEEIPIGRTYKNAVLKKLGTNPDQ
ncbi:MAG: LytTR family DNA-binding domain-containing protein [Bacteroidetes bacterium]|nr:LytTR family DNA-binding domain-containing protein [Bacteroidota bacterium]